jgi:hypothetical protein
VHRLTVSADYRKLQQRFTGVSENSSFFPLKLQPTQIISTSTYAETNFLFASSFSSSQHCTFTELFVIKVESGPTVVFCYIERSHTILAFHYPDFPPSTCILLIIDEWVTTVAPPGGRKRRICVYLFLQNVTTVVLIIHRDRVFNVNFGP